MRTSVGICAFAAVVGFATGARAQPDARSEEPALGARGHVVLSLERLFGVDHVSETQTMNGATIQTYSTTSVSVLRQSQFVGSIPRFAADLFLRSAVSLGAAVGIAHGTETFNLSGGPSTSETMTSFLFAPRVGYVLRLAPWLSVWPRAGVTWAYTTGDVPDASTGGQASVWSQAWLATVDVPLALAIVPRVAFTLAPTLDVTLASKSEAGAAQGPTSMSQAKLVEVGLMAGLVVLL